MTQENVDSLREGFEEFARGDLEAVRERLDPEIEWEPAIAPILGVETIRGRAAVMAFFARDLSEGFDEFRAEPLSYEDLGDDMVLVTTRYAGRGESSGLEIDQTFVSLYCFRNGRTVSMHDYRTRDEALEAAGLRESAMSQENVEVVRAAYEVLVFRRLTGSGVASGAGFDIRIAHLWALRDGKLVRGRGSATATRRSKPSGCGSRGRSRSPAAHLAGGPCSVCRSASDDVVRAKWE